MDDARYFDEGKLVVFKRNRIYQHRSFLNGSYVWRTLKTSALEEAITKGQKAHYYLLAQQEQGLPIKDVIADAWRFSPPDAWRICHQQARLR